MSKWSVETKKKEDLLQLRVRRAPGYLTSHVGIPGPGGREWRKGSGHPKWYNK